MFLDETQVVGIVALIQRVQKAQVDVSGERGDDACPLFLLSSGQRSKGFCRGDNAEPASRDQSLVHLSVRACSEGGRNHAEMDLTKMTLRGATEIALASRFFLQLVSTVLGPDLSGSGDPVVSCGFRPVNLGSRGEGCVAREIRLFWLLSGA